MKLLLCSTDSYFVENFGDYVSKKRPKLEVLSYTKEDAAKEWLTSKKPTLVLCEDGLLAGYEGEAPFIVLGMSTIMPKEDGKGGLNIYQKSEQILDDLDRILAIIGGATHTLGSNQMNIAVYSSEGGSGKTTIGYLTAVQCAETRRTAYVNLELSGYCDNLYTQNFPHTMEEILFAQKSKLGLNELLYETLKQNEDGVFVLPLINSVGDYRDMDSQTVKELCQHIHQAGIEWIVMDLPSGMGTLEEEILTDSDRIVWVFSDTRTGNGREEKIRKDPYLKSWIAKSVFCKNRCAQQKETDGETARFPMSNTIRETEHIARVLEGNPAFVKGCKAIVDALEGK